MVFLPHLLAGAEWQTEPRMAKRVAWEDHPFPEESRFCSDVLLPNLEGMIRLSVSRISGLQKLTF